MRFKSIPLATVLALAPIPLAAQNPTPPQPSPAAVEQLRHAIGLWDVTTEFIGADGAIQGTTEGQYRFGWVVPDRVIQGMSTIPAWNQASAILFFVRPVDREIEMVSVGADGHLWRMTGPDDSETRTTPNTPQPDGSTVMLRFTRYEVTADTFRSRMELSNDGGATWRLGNRQSFRRSSDN